MKIWAWLQPGHTLHLREKVHWVFVKSILFTHGPLFHYFSVNETSLMEIRYYTVLRESLVIVLGDEKEGRSAYNKQFEIQEN